MAKELNETFPGIEAVNDFYTPYYMKEYFPDEVKNASTPWKQLPPEERPARLLKEHAPVVHRSHQQQRERSVSS